ncbi:MAG: SgcJ/EcaC family oxidoreductase [Terracidiphilus sp.]
MKTRPLAFLILLSLVFPLANQSGRGEKAAETTKEEAALQKRAEAFVAAFNKADAKALGAFYTANADTVTPEGEHLKGRKAIVEAYQKLFAKTKGARLFIRITSLRLAAPNLALEDGLTEVVLPEGPPSAARYSVVYVKQDGEWYIESVREAIAVPPSNSKYLQDLGFLIGNWVEDADKGSSKASYSWAEGGNFIVNNFDVIMNQIPVGGGTQWIGWDAAAKKPRSWAFAFNGGFAEGLWTKDGNKWNIAVAATLAAGKKASATNVLTKIDDDHFSIHLVKRSVDGKALPDEKVVKMKRLK